MNKHYIKLWLLIFAILTISIIILGGFTRLTGSGLSIVEWKPVVGSIPPLSENQWLEEFEKYKSFPEYKKVNYGINLNEFKFIFLTEYLHRLLARSLGLFFIIPFLFFAYKKAIKNYPPYLLILMLGMTQGFAGWYMVKSGLINEPHVCHYRLGLHLMLAFFIYSLTVSLLFDEENKINNIKAKSTSSLSSLCSSLYLLLVLVYVQIFFGALVAGLKAGLIYNTFPMMGDGILPDEIDTYAKLLDLNTPAIVQFWHRTFAYSIFVLAFFISLKLYKNKQKKEGGILISSITLQFLLGILTLLYSVPLELGLLHQLGGIVFITSVIYVIKKQPS